MSSPVTRMEIMEAVLSAFDRTPCDRAGLVRAASESGARAEVLNTLSHVPNWPFTEVTELWLALPGAMPTH